MPQSRHWIAVKDDEGHPWQVGGNEKYSSAFNGYRQVVVKLTESVVEFEARESAYE
jgi:hypothetical protein